MKTIDTAQVLLKHLPKDVLTADVKPFVYKAFQALEAGHLCIDAQADDALFEENHPLYNVESFGSGTKFYLNKYWSIETSIFSKLQELIVLGNEKISDRKCFLNKHSKIISTRLFSIYKADGSRVGVDWQKIASLNAFLHNFAIITGGPGTGKTTTVAKLLYLLYLEAEGKSLRVELVSQTGKAAARLKESLMASTTDSTYGIGSLDPKILNLFADIQPKTIHRLLGVKQNGDASEFNSKNPLSADVVIVDEATMADAPLLSKLLGAIGSGARLYLLGDKNQLSSVEIGSVFSDLCWAKLDVVSDLSELVEANFFKSFLSDEEQVHFEPFVKNHACPDFINHIVELKRSYRFNDTQQIGRLASDIVGSSTLQMSDLEPYTGDQAKEVRFLEFGDNLNSVFSVFEQIILEKDVQEALKALNKVKVLCALKRDVAEYNIQVEQYLVRKNRIAINQRYYHNQPIMVTANDYFTGLYNGDVGLIRENEAGELRAYFEFPSADGTSKELKNFSPSGIHSFETAYAISIHKSQGSEFETVLMVLPQQADEKILSKELVYTGLTRAKKQAFILGSKTVFLDAVQQSVSRISGLGNRIAQHRIAK